MKKYVNSNKGLYLRGNTFYVRKIIPANLRSIAGKSEFIVSLKTSKYELAIQKYTKVLEGIDYTIKTMIDGTYVSDAHTFDHFVNLAAANGRQLECLTTYANKPEKISEITRLLKDAEDSGKLTKQKVQSFMSVKTQAVKISNLLEIYLEANKLSLNRLNKREHDRKINPFKNACKQLTNHLKKDKTVYEISRSDARSFYKALKDRVFEKQITANTANKYLTHIRVLIDTYHNENDLDASNVFHNLSFTNEKNKRKAIPVEFIKREWIENPVLNNMDPQLKALLWVMIDTGCGFKELCGLIPDEDIHLDTDIPYIRIVENDERKLKTTFRTRKMPLVGLAHAAFKAYPNGFEKYRSVNGSTNASGALNKFLRENNLFEDIEQKASSTRHTFKDRLRAKNIQGELQDRLMGHKTPGMGSHYGEGYELKQMHEAMLLIEQDFD